MNKEYAFIRYMSNDFDLKVDYEFALNLQRGDLIIYKNYETNEIASWVQEVIENHIPITKEEIEENRYPLQFFVVNKFYILNRLEVWVKMEKDENLGIIRFQNCLE